MFIRAVTSGIFGAPLAGEWVNINRPKVMWACIIRAWPPPPQLMILFIIFDSCTSAALPLTSREEAGGLGLWTAVCGAVHKDRVSMCLPDTLFGLLVWCTTSPSPLPSGSQVLQSHLWTLLLLSPSLKHQLITQSSWKASRSSLPQDLCSCIFLCLFFFKSFCL